MYIYGLRAQQVNHCGSEPSTIDLESISANVVIRGFVADLTVELVYRNKYETAVEVAYLCPVDAKAAIYSFEAKLEGRTITAYCVEKKKAQQTYKDAVNQGYTAIIGFEDKMSGDLFHLSLGNLPQGEVAKLSLKMVVELPVAVDGGITFTLPTVFNPRYCPLDQPSGPENFASMPFQSVIPNRSPYSLEVKGEVRGNFKIAKVTSEKDPINVEICDDETTAVVTQYGGSKLDHDWNFQVYYQTVHRPQALQMSGDRSSTDLMKDDVLMLNIFPEIPVESFSPHNELIFVVDRSGSMHGSNIEHTKNTLLLFLKSLPPGCRFNIISFGNTYTSLFGSSSERYTEDTLKKALQLQKSMDADMGGTEIMAPLRHVYSMDLISGYARQMIVMTDGAVWNQEQIFDLVARHAGETRVFAVGIGDGASTALVQGIAEAGRGRYEMVSQASQLQTKVMGLVTSMLQDSISEVKIDIEADPPQTVSLVPEIPPVVFGGQHLILYARILPKTTIKSIKVSSKIMERGISLGIDVNDCKVVHDSNFTFHRLATKAQLKKWELEDKEGNADSMIALSISSNVICKATALVGIDQDGRNINALNDPCVPFGSTIFTPNPSHTSFAPLGSITACSTSCSAPLNARRTKGFSFGQVQANSSNSNVGFGAMLFGASAPPPAHTFSVQGFGFGQNQTPLSTSTPFSGVGSSQVIPTSTLQFENCQQQCRVPKFPCDQTQRLQSPPGIFGSFSPSFSANKSFNEETKNEKSQDICLTIASTQNFDGSWDFKHCEKFAKMPSSRLKEIQMELCLEDKSFATVFVLALLETKFASRKKEWKLLYIKGRMFLGSQSLDAAPLIEKCSQNLRNILED